MNYGWATEFGTGVENILKFNEEILGSLIHDAVAGLITPAAALETAQEKIKTLMRQTGYYKKR